MFQSKIYPRWGDKLIEMAERSKETSPLDIRLISRHAKRIFVDSTLQNFYSTGSQEISYFFSSIFRECATRGCSSSARTGRSLVISSFYSSPIDRFTKKQKKKRTKCRTFAYSIATRSYLSEIGT